jgi:hypothetical protein
MKKIVTSFFVICFLMTSVALVSAQTGGQYDSWDVAVKPAASLGVLWSLGNTNYSLTAHNGGIGGVTERQYKYDGFPAVYLEAKIPVMLTKRLELALSGSWAIPVVDTDVKHEDYAGSLLGGRTWDTKTTLLTANLQASYAVVKNLGILKSLAPAVGLRLDYAKTSYDSPHDVSSGFGAAAYTDSAEFYSSALLPYVGVTAVLGDFKAGKFGGALKLSLIGGWTAWGEVQHEEWRNGGADIRFDQFKGDLDSDSYFVEVGGEFTMFSFALSQRAEGALSLFTKYSFFHAKGELDGVRSGTMSEVDIFDFNMNRSGVTTGITGTIKF